MIWTDLAVTGDSFTTSPTMCRVPVLLSVNGYIEKWVSTSPETKKAPDFYILTGASVLESQNCIHHDTRIDTRGLGKPNRIWNMVAGEYCK
jgi:hypothetical protein